MSCECGLKKVGNAYSHPFWSVLGLKIEANGNFLQFYPCNNLGGTS